MTSSQLLQQVKNDPSFKTQTLPDGTKRYYKEATLVKSRFKTNTPVTDKYPIREIIVKPNGEITEINNKKYGYRIDKRTTGERYFAASTNIYRPDGTIKTSRSGVLVDKGSLKVPRAGLTTSFDTQGNIITRIGKDFDGKGRRVRTTTTTPQGTQVRTKARTNVLRARADFLPSKAEKAAGIKTRNQIKIFKTPRGPTQLLFNNKTFTTTRPPNQQQLNLLFAAGNQRDLTKRFNEVESSGVFLPQKFKTEVRREIRKKQTQRSVFSDLNKSANRSNKRVGVKAGKVKSKKAKRRKSKKAKRSKPIGTVTSREPKNLKEKLLLAREKNIGRSSDPRASFEERVFRGVALGAVFGALGGAQGYYDLITHPISTVKAAAKELKNPTVFLRKEAKRFQVDPVGVVTEYYTFGKLLGKSTQLAKRSKVGRFVREEVYIRSQPKQIRPAVRKIIKSAKIQEKINPFNVKGIKKVDFLEVKNLTKTEARALKKTLKQTDSVVFGSLASRTLSKKKTPIPKDVDIATKSVTQFNRKFINNLPKNKRALYTIKKSGRGGTKLIRKIDGGDLFDLKPLSTLIPERSILTRRGYIPVSGYVKQIGKGKKSILPRVKKRAVSTATEVPTQKLVKVEGIRLVGFGEQTTRKALGTLQVLIEKNVRRAKDPVSLLKSLEVQLKAAKKSKPKTIIGKARKTRRVRVLKDSVKLLKSKSFQRLLEKKVPGITKNYPLVAKINTKKLPQVRKTKVVGVDVKKEKLRRVRKKKSSSKRKAVRKRVVKKRKVRTTKKRSVKKRRVKRSVRKSRVPKARKSRIPKSKVPSKVPKGKPSKVPKGKSSKTPSNIPKRKTSKVPSKVPKKTPSKFPSKKPSKVPSKVPSKTPSKVPRKTPSTIPSKVPSRLKAKTTRTPPTKVPGKRKKKKTTDTKKKKKGKIKRKRVRKLTANISGSDSKGVTKVRKRFTGLETRTTKFNTKKKKKGAKNGKKKKKK